MAMKGIDISYAQGNNIDFNAVKESGVEFVIIQIGYGKEARQKDVCFERNYAAAKAAGLKVGGYWFSYAESPQEAEQEANACMTIIKGKTFDMPIYYDLEDDPKAYNGKGYYPFKKGRDHCSALVTAFCTAMERGGYFAGFYISRCPLQTHITPQVAERFALWVAEYAEKCNYSGAYGMWQCTSTANVPGINNGVDLDYCNVDYLTPIRAEGLNGFPKPTPAKTEQQSAPKTEEKPIKITVDLNGSKYSGTIKKQ